MPNQSLLKNKTNFEFEFSSRFVLFLSGAEGRRVKKRVWYTLFSLSREHDSAVWPTGGRERVPSRHKKKNFTSSLVPKGVALRKEYGILFLA